MKIFTNCKVFEDSGFSLMGRFRKPSDASYMQKADISSISLTVFNAQTNRKLVDALALTVSSVVFDTLQTDNFWTDEHDVAIDAIGYNFRYDGLASQIPDGGITYRFEVKFTPASGQPFHAAWEIGTLNLLRS